MSNFHPLEVVGRGSETQLQAGGNINKIYLAEKGLTRLNVTTSSLNRNVH